MFIPYFCFIIPNLLVLNQRLLVVNVTLFFFFKSQFPTHQQNENNIQQANNKININKCIKHG